MQAVEIRVWDPFIRIFHWLFTTAVLVDWFTDDDLPLSFSSTRS
jgi:cytochrome b